MVIIRIMAGAGNQMFQYALAYEYLTQGKKVKIDTTFFDTVAYEEGNTFRPSFKQELECFELEEASANEIDRAWKRNGSYFWRGMGLLHLLRKKRPVITDNGKESYTWILDRRNVYLNGYWQSEDYFKNIEKQLQIKWRKALAKQLDETNKKLAERILSDNNSVSIHIRGGDYFNQYNIARFGGVCGADYYKAAVAKLNEYENLVTGGFLYYIFTNDKEYATRLLEDIFESEKSWIFVDNPEELALTDIYLMSCCKHNIIANSSFSWWGAYLNEYSDKKVIAPKKWTETDEHQDIYCDDWIRV